jgi:hypothetical protein
MEVMAVISIAAATLAMVKVVYESVGWSVPHINVWTAVLVLVVAPTIIAAFPVVRLWRQMNRRK